MPELQRECYAGVDDLVPQDSSVAALINMHVCVLTHYRLLAPQTLRWLWHHSNRVRVRHPRPGWRGSQVMWLLSHYPPLPLRSHQQTTGHSSKDSNPLGNPVSTPSSLVRLQLGAATVTLSLVAFTTRYRRPNSAMMRAHCTHLRPTASPAFTAGRQYAALRGRLMVCAVAATETSALPRSVSDMVQQAAESVQQTQRSGCSRQLLQLLNPVNKKAVNFLSTEPIDYPCSNFKEFETIVGLAKDVLQQLSPGSQLKTRRIDEGGIDGDLCAIVSTADNSIVALVWPTAEKLKELKQLAEQQKGKLLLVVNPLWKTEGNLVSELGIGPWRKANEEFLATFDSSYLLYEQRIGAPSSINMASGTRYESGAVVRVLRRSPGQYVVHVMAANGASQAIGGFDGKPTYKQLEDLIAKARAAKVQIFDVAKAASSLDLEPGQDTAAGRAAAAAALAAAEAGLAAGSSGGQWYSTAQVGEGTVSIWRADALQHGTSRCPFTWYSTQAVLAGDQ